MPTNTKTMDTDELTSAAGATTTNSDDNEQIMQDADKSDNDEQIDWNNDGNTINPDSEFDKNEGDDDDAQSTMSRKDEQDEDELTMNELRELKAQQNLSKEQALQRCLEKMDRYSPIIPDLVLEHYLTSAGFQCKDIRIKRLIGLAAQKFISDIAHDAFQYSRVSAGSATSSSGVNATGHAGRLKNDRSSSVLTIEDLSSALSEYGVNLKRPEFYR